MRCRKVKAAGPYIRMPKLVLQKRKTKIVGDKAGMMPLINAKLAQKKLALLRRVKVASRTAGEILLRRNLGERWKRTCSISFATASRAAFRAGAFLAAR